MSSRRLNAPYKRTRSDGRSFWVARYTALDGSRRYAPGEFKTKREAQSAIDKALGAPIVANPETVEGFFRTWQHPRRSTRTAIGHKGKVGGALKLLIEGRPLGGWRLDELRRKHIEALLDRLLTDEGRAAKGAKGILASLSVMFEDAISLDVAGANPVRGVRVIANDTRVQKPPKEPRVFSWEVLHRLAAAGRAEVRLALDPRPNGAKIDYEPMLRTVTDTGLRIGEVFALKRANFDGKGFLLEGTGWGTQVLPSNPHKNHDRLAPCSPTLAEMIRRAPTRIDSDLLFPTPRGAMWAGPNFYRDVWKPAQTAAGLDVRPHEARHSFVSHLLAAGIDPADLADMAGHKLATMLAVYAHPLRKSHDEVREVLG